MTSARILIADRSDFAHVLKTHLAKEGFEVDIAASLSFSETDFSANTPDLLIVSDELCGEEALLLDVCAKVRVAVIVIANDRNTDRAIALLERGADDVLTKPLELRLLSARVKALLRRVGMAALPSHGDIIRFDNFEISQEKFELKLCGKKVEIPPKELQLLYCLAASPNRVFSREQLLEHVWDFAFLGDSRTVDVHIKRLREKLSGVSSKWALKTVWGVGYKFEVYH